jgi:hypothetical protein
MILAIPVAVGILGGLGRAFSRGERWALPEIRAAWLVILAFIPQWLVFQLEATREQIPDGVAAGIFMVSQVLLLIFAWFNRREPWFWLLGLGVMMNFLVIFSNGGFMPISPETVKSLLPQGCNGWEVGQRLGTGKDIVLAASDTRLWILSDRFLTPDWLPYRVAFSMGDILIACGTVGLLLAGRSVSREILYPKEGSNGK